VHTVEENVCIYQIKYSVETVTYLELDRSVIFI